MAGKLNIKLKDISEKPIDETKSAMDTEPIVDDVSTEIEEMADAIQEMEPESDVYKDDSPEVCESKVGHLDLLKSALTLIIAKAEAIDIPTDKPKLLGKLKGALEILNQN